MDASTAVDDYIPTFYVGQHESRRALPVTEHVLRQAQDCNVGTGSLDSEKSFLIFLQYDMLTTPITTPHFHSRVLALLSNHLSQLSSGDAANRPGRQHPAPVIPALSPVDTPLTPGDVISQVLAVASPWIDLCSPDPLIYNISRQVLYLEIAYAAFCGIGNVIVPGPKLHHGNLHGAGLTLYARAIQEALAAGNYLQIHIMLPIIDHPDTDNDDEMGSLVPFAREEYLGVTLEDRPRKADIFGTWDAWNLVRTVCKYNARLFVGKESDENLYSVCLALCEY